MQNLFSDMFENVSPMGAICSDGSNMYGCLTCDSSCVYNCSEYCADNCEGGEGGCTGCDGICGVSCTIFCAAGCSGWMK